MPCDPGELLNLAFLVFWAEPGSRRIAVIEVERRPRKLWWKLWVPKWF